MVLAEDVSDQFGHRGWYPEYTAEPLPERAA